MRARVRVCVFPYGLVVRVQKRRCAEKVETEDGAEKSGGVTGAVMVMVLCPHDRASLRRRDGTPPCFHRTSRREGGDDH